MPERTIRAAMEDANQAFAAVSQKLYETAGAEQQPAEGTTGGPVGGGSPHDPNVIDAEFEKKD